MDREVKYPILLYGYSTNALLQWLCENPRATRSLSRRFGNDDSPDTQAQGHARVCAGPAHQTEFQRPVAGRRGLALPSSATDAESGLGKSGVGHLVNQPSGTNLSADSGRA